MSRNATARRMRATSAPIAAYLDDFERRAKAAHVPRAERRRLIRALTHGDMTVLEAEARFDDPVDRILEVTSGEPT